MTKSEIQKYRKKNNLNNLYITGIDVSSTVCGYATLFKRDEDSDLQLIKYGYHIFDNDLPMYNRMLEFREKISPQVGHSSYFVLEDRLKSFGARTTAETLMKLAWINAGVEIELKDMVGEDKVLQLHPMSARSCAWGQPYPTGKEKEIFTDTKDWVIDNVVKEFNIEKGSEGFEIKTRSRKTPKPWKDWTGDICDAVTLARALFN